MVIANSNKHIAPYWNSSTNLKMGLNQLGIRNVAEQMFARLLPGLNNVSSRIRYYSFYCWLIQHFYKDKDYVNEKDFNPYLRRAELLLAFINGTKDNSQGIPGINYVLQQFQDNIEFISLKEGAKNSDGSYWANPGGIFRQYYSASLEEIGLIGVNVNSSQIYNITRNDGFVNGEILAESFASSVGDDGRLFLNLLTQDDVNVEELRKLNDSFSMKLMPDTSHERNILQRLLLQKDQPASDSLTFHRHNTIKYVLEYLYINNVSLDAIGFSKHMYLEYHRGQKDLTTWGWYAYFLDDNWQYQLTRLFHSVLLIIKNSKDLWTPIENVLENISNSIINDMGIEASTPLNELLSMISLSNNNTVTDAVNNLLWYYKENVSMIDESVQHYHEINVEYETFFDFMRKVTNNLQNSTSTFIKQLVTEDVIYRHYSVSFRKMLQTGLATQKFSIESGCLRFIDDWDTSHTSPRIDTLRNFLIDLRLINIDGKVSPLGVELLSAMNNEHS